MSFFFFFFLLILFGGLTSIRAFGHSDQSELSTTILRIYPRVFNLCGVWSLHKQPCRHGDICLLGEERRCAKKKKKKKGELRRFFDRVSHVPERSIGSCKPCLDGCLMGDPVVLSKSLAVVCSPFLHDQFLPMVGPVDDVVSPMQAKPRNTITKSGEHERK